MSRPLAAVLVVVVSGFSTAALAVDEDLAPGAGTRQWIDLQMGGTVASQEARPMPGDIADRIYNRYADSFSLPIPQKFERESFTTDNNK